MTSTADDSHPPPAADVHRSTAASLHVGKDSENEEQCDDHGNENAREDQDNVDALQNPVTLPETDPLGLGNEAVKGGATDAIATEKSESKSEAPISPIISRNPSEIEDDQRGVIYDFHDFPPGLSILNVNGRPKFEIVAVRDKGRLQMFMEPNLSPQLVRSPGRNGRLKMWLLNDDHQLHGGGERVLPPVVRRSI